MLFKGDPVLDERYRALFERLASNYIKADADMSSYTSFRTGGRAAALIEARSAADVCDAICAADENGIEYHVIGRGTNLLVSDNGIDALVICISDKMGAVEKNGLNYIVEAGASYAAFAKRTVDEGCTGLEWAAGIPGSTGGAVAMNAGAYIGETKNVLKEVEYIENGVTVRRAVESSDMDYRKSVFCAPQKIVTKAYFSLSADEDGQAAKRMREFNMARREKQPLNYPSAGSTFKRPQGYFAGKLIEDAGLKGETVGGAQVSMLHAGFIINRGNATSADVYKLIKLVQKRVYDKSGVMLEPEVRFIGCFD